MRNYLLNLAEMTKTCTAPRDMSASSLRNNNVILCKVGRLNNSQPSSNKHQKNDKYHQHPAKLGGTQIVKQREGFICVRSTLIISPTHSHTTWSLLKLINITHRILYNILNIRNFENILFLLSASIHVFFHIHIYVLVHPSIISRY